MTKTDPFYPKKTLGQNFLIHARSIDRIIAACQLRKTDNILEIGPGKGALTHILSQQTKNVIAVEKDEKLAQMLKDDFHNTNVTIVHDDILKFAFDKLPKDTKIIGNLPYNIATPIIKKVIRHKKNFNTFYATVQLEFGQRIAAQPNTKSYGSLSCFMQYYSDIKILFKIKNSAFFPAPKVQSCFLHFNFLNNPRCKAKDEGHLFKIIRACFGQRRKMIQNSLSSVYSKETILDVLEAEHINPKLRAENLSLNDYIKISNAVSQ